MTDDRPVRIALEFAALAQAVRTYVAEHPASCICVLCAALTAVDRRKP